MSLREIMATYERGFDEASEIEGLSDYVDTVKQRAADAAMVPLNAVKARAVAAVAAPLREARDKAVATATKVAAVGAGVLLLTIILLRRKDA